MEQKKPGEPGPTGPAIEPHGAEEGPQNGPQSEQQPGPDDAPKGPQNAKEQLYDKIPLTFRQVDILVKVLLAAFVIVLIIAIATGGLFR